MKTFAGSFLLIGSTLLMGCATPPSRSANSTTGNKAARLAVTNARDVIQQRKGDESQASSSTPAPEPSPIRQVAATTQLNADEDHAGNQPLSPEREILPINLATALQLSSATPIDVELAAERVRAATAALDLAKAAWLPTITFGGDYNRHDGPIQAIDGSIIRTGRSSTMFGLGSGIGPAAIFSPNDAIFGPLAARQIVEARNADTRVANNNTMVAVTDAYFTIEQARGELAGATDATQRAEEVLNRVRKLSTGLVSPLEIVRAETHVARRRAAESSARERRQFASAELIRLLRLDALAQVEPVEPPSLEVKLIDENRTVDELVVVGLTNRPELAANQAQVQATLTFLRQEKLRPLIPSVLLRGWSTPVTGTLGVGVFGGGSNGTIGSSGIREDFDVQLLWQLDNLGFGNAARIRGRQSDLRAMTLELFRIQDRVAADVSQAHVQAQEAHRRLELAEAETKLALESYNKNIEGLGQIVRAGELVQTVVRPQEVLASVQDLAQAYVNYYSAVADSNRAQFRLYRALGQPAGLLTPIAEDTEPPPPDPANPPEGGRNP